jgi:cytochrome c oxidase subunit IV
LERKFMSDQPSHSHGPIVETHGAAAAHADPHAQAHGAHEAHHGSTGLYIAVFVALCFLTACSFFTTSRYWPWHDQPQVGWAFMMAVSCTKAMLVILFFMHILWEANWKFVLTIPAALMSIFLLLMLIPDVGMRGRWASEERQHQMAVPRPAAHSSAWNEAATAEKH